jgi:hypothetical protein
MADGTSKPISKIKVGDKVANGLPGSPPGTEDQSHVVTAVHVTLTDKAYTDVTVQTTTGSYTIAGTTHHLYWDATTQAWTPGDHLHIGDQLQSSMGRTLAITGLRTYIASRTTYNLTIDGLHTYYVEAGNTPILVHNCGTGTVGTT